MSSSVSEFQSDPGQVILWKTRMTRIVMTSQGCIRIYWDKVHKSALQIKIRQTNIKDPEPMYWKQNKMNIQEKHQIYEKAFGKW